MEKRLLILSFFSLFSFNFSECAFFAKLDHGIAEVTHIRNELKKDSLKVEAKRPVTVKGKKRAVRRLEIKPKQTVAFKDIKVDGAGLTVSSFYKMLIKNFSAGTVLNLNPMQDEGFAWMGKSLENPGNSSLYFRVKADDKGEASVVFSNEISEKFLWKIVIGAKENSESQIIKTDTKTKLERVVYRISKEENSFAAIKPGRYDEQYWVSINDGLMIVGKGPIGDNPFMSLYDPDISTKLNRVGFGSGVAPVEYLDVKRSLPVTVSSNWRPYFTSKGNPEVKKTKDGFDILKTPLRVPGRGCVAFEAKGDAVSVAFGDNFEYELLIGVDANSRTVLKRKGKEVASILAESCPDIVIDSEDEFYKYWVSIDNGEILFGKGEVGENLLFVWQDSDPVKFSTELSLGSIASSGAFEIFGSTSFKNIKIGTSTSLILSTKKEYYQHQKESFMYPNSFVVISPLKYALFQLGQHVGVKDLIVGPTYYLQKVPEQDAKYFFMFVIKDDGSPDLVWMKGPEESKGKIDLKRAAYITNVTADITAQVSGGVSMGAGMDTGGLLAAGAGIALGGAAIVAKTGAAFMDFELSRYRGSDSYVFMEAANREAMAGVSVPQRAKENKRAIMLRVQEALFEEDPKVLSTMYQDIIDLVNHFYVVEDPYVKKKIFAAIEKLYDIRYKQQSIDFYAALLKLLTGARDNPYLTDVSNEQEKKLKDQWYTWSNEITRELFEARNKTEAGVSLPPSYGEYFWLKDKFKTAGQGSVSFEAKALNDVFVCFGQRAFKTRNTTNQIYEIVLGAWNNTKTVIRVASLGKTVTEFLDVDYPDAMIDPLEFKKYWVSLKDGVVSIGKGKLDPKNVLLKWKDPYPIERIRYVGVSSWNAKVDIRNVKVGLPVEDVSVSVVQKDKKVIKKVEKETKKAIKRAEREPVKVIKKSEREDKQVIEKAEKETSKAIEDVETEMIKEAARIEREREAEAERLKKEEEEWRKQVKERTE